MQTTDDQRAQAIDKVDALMTQLRTTKVRGQLRKVTNLKPLRHNDTRCASRRCVLLRYKRFASKIKNADNSVFPRETRTLMPSIEEDDIIDDILKDDTDFESVSLALQRDVTDPNYVSIHRAREMFNDLIHDHSLSG
jgi:hypothetical protein